MKLVRDGLVVQWPDTHVPDQHQPAVRNLTRFVGDVQPAAVVLTGDFLDCLSTARWSADTLAEDGSTFQRELDEGRTILARLRDVFDGPIAWLPGNHEDRLEKWGRTRGKGIWGIDALTVPHLLGFDDLGIETPEPPFEFAPGCVAIHGEKLGQKSGQSVAKELDRFGSTRSVVMGHCHRLAVTYRSTYDRVVWGMEGGHLMDQSKADYLRYGVADWQLGFGVVAVSRRSTNPTVVPMAQNGSFTFEGVVWK